MIESRSVAGWIQNPEGAWMKMGKKTSWADGNVLYLDCGGGDTTVYICQNSNCTLKIAGFYNKQNIPQ